MKLTSQGPQTPILHQSTTPLPCHLSVCPCRFPNQQSSPRSRLGGAAGSAWLSVLGEDRQGSKAGGGNWGGGGVGGGTRRAGLLLPSRHTF